jgi:hypothetical protein
VQSDSIEDTLEAFLRPGLCVGSALGLVHDELLGTESTVDLEAVVTVYVTRLAQ